MSVTASAKADCGLSKPSAAQESYEAQQQRALIAEILSGASVPAPERAAAPASDVESRFKALA